MRLTLWAGFQRPRTIAAVELTVGKDSAAIADGTESLDEGRRCSRADPNKRISQYIMLIRDLFSLLS